MVEAATPAKLERYYRRREFICTMDMLQWRSATGTGWAIRNVTREDVNHTSAALLLPTYFASRRFSIEAYFEDGLDIYPLSKILAGFEGKVWWYGLRQEFHHLAPSAARWLLERVGITDYDTAGCLSHARRILGRTPKPAEAASLYCSESVFLAWRDGAKVQHLQDMACAPVPGQPMEALGLWAPGERIL